MLDWGSVPVWVGLVVTSCGFATTVYQLRLGRQDRQEERISRVLRRPSAAPRQDLIALVVDLRARDVGFRSLTEGIDTTTPGGRFVLVVLAGLAEMERELIRERTIAGLAAGPYA